MITEEVWDLVDWPQDKNVIEELWLFWKKHLSDGSIKFKARFVAMGYTQIPGLDYGETFLHTGKLASLRLLIALAAYHGWEIHQMDTVAAFLNGIPDEDIYVEQPNEFVKQGNEEKVYKLTKALHRLRQSPKIWQDKVMDFLTAIVFSNCEADHCIYFWRLTNSFTAVYFQVDDMAITGSKITTFKVKIKNKWEMNDMVLASTVVWFHIWRVSDNSYFITQSNFSDTILARFNMTDIKLANKPFPAGLKLYRASEEEAHAFCLEKRPYREVGGSYQFAQGQIFRLM